MALVMKKDKPLDPADIRLLRPHTVVPHPDRLPNLVEQLRLVRSGSPSHPTNNLVWLTRSRDTLLFNPRPHWSIPWIQMTSVRTCRNIAFVHMRTFWYFGGATPARGTAAAPSGLLSAGLLVAPQSEGSMSTTSCEGSRSGRLRGASHIAMAVSWPT